jgi:hypothetical protein
MIGKQKLAEITILLFIIIPKILFGGKPATEVDFQGGRTRRVWIYLRDDPGVEKYFTPIVLPERAQRRLALRSGSSCDQAANMVPVSEIRAMVAANVLRLRYYSRFLRAYSAEINIDELNRLQKFEIVRRIDLVGCNVRKPFPDNPEYRKPGAVLTKTQSEFYQKQLSQLNIPVVHANGITGRGVRIGIIDTGFFLDHEVFRDIITTERLIATYDFINDDENVRDETENDINRAQSVHGTAVWSQIGGYNPSIYIGAAYGAEFLLAKTEQNGTEIRQEEDDFVAAVEWCDYWGADIISVSLGYRDFYGGFEYAWEELDGNTTVTTRVVNWAFERGILVVCSAGNDAQNFDDGGLLSPGDAFGALTVGAVDSCGIIAGFSSHGPTYDGRIKPDLCAMGIRDYLASASSASAYYYSNGTSYAAPLIAGAAALLLESLPELTPGEIMTELKRYADRANNPDNRYGWGIPDVYRSIVDYVSPGFPGTEPSTRQILAYPNPARMAVNFYFIWHKANPAAANAKLQVFDLRGGLVFEKELASGYLGKKEIVTWNICDQSGRKAASGVYIVRLQNAGYLKIAKFLILK